MNEEENLKSIIKIFFDKWDNTEGIWNKEFIPNLDLTYKGFELKISFGKGKRIKPPKYPYITFLKYNQKTRQGIYPYISYEENKLITGLGISRDNTPKIDEEIIKEIDDFPFTTFSINEIDLLIDKLNENISKFELIFNKQGKNMENKIELKIKNIMLYGAPGVGKTYNYKKLVALIEGGDFKESEIFDFIVNNKDDEIEKGSVDKLYNIVKNENRLEFVTFHQSYSYEDFIEGFRPQDDGTISLETGIFKKFCEKARENLENSKKDINKLNKERNIKLIFDKFVENLIEKSDFNLTNSVDISKIDDKAFYYTSKSQKMENSKVPFKDVLELINKNIEEQKNISLLENISGTSRQRPTYPYAIYRKFLDYKKQFREINEQKIEKEGCKNYYIVIDEINRGNISKIFGELITLIEEDKRDIYEVTLPYSKDDIKFTIPSNLYIIATMNSTDKSIATIDIALRRRFTFLKMKPQESLVHDENAKKLFINLNKFIEETLGEDYKLGHSYFMQDLDLEFVKEYKIKPLLEEYFYGDDTNYKIALDILNRKDNL